MKRDPSLVPLSHQHHNGLALCVLTDRALAGDDSPEQVGQLGERIATRYDVELANHFEIEEQILFPACPPELAGLVAQLLAEHRQIEAIVGAIKEGPTTSLLRDFIELMRRHIRLEEDELFEKLQETLSRATLEDLGREIEARVVRVRL